MRQSAIAPEQRPPHRLVHVTTVPETLAFLNGQAAYLRARGIEVHALSSPGEWAGTFRTREQVPVHTVELTRRITPLHDLRAVGRIRRIVRQVRPDIVHGHTPKGGLLAMIAASLEGVPVRIYHLHGLPLMTATGLKRRLLQWTETISCRLAHQVLCVSNSVREVAIAEGLCPAHKIKVLLGGSINGVDADGQFNPARLPAATRTEIRNRYGIPPDATVAGFVGRIVRDKGMAELAWAWRTLREEYPQLHLLMVGPFEPQDPVPTEVEALLREDPRIHLVGVCWETPPLYAAMDLVILPTYREGFPVVPLEAAAMGLPVVATRIPGCVEAVQDRTTGLLVPVRDAAALAEAIRGYLHNPELARRHGRAGRERVLCDFRREAMWEALSWEYARLLRTAGRLPEAACGDEASACSTVHGTWHGRARPLTDAARPWATPGSQPPPRDGEGSQTLFSPSPSRGGGWGERLPTDVEG
jgi:glycosyltransferase involved in cell wall biosynthesis